MPRMYCKSKWEGTAVLQDTSLWLFGSLLQFFDHDEMACFMFDSFEPIGNFPEQVTFLFFSHVDFSETGEPRKKPWSVGLYRGLYYPVV